MVGEVDEGGLIGFSLVVDSEIIFLGYLECYLDKEVAGITLLPVGADALEN